jgi:hypothetical protein
MFRPAVAMAAFALICALAPPAEAKEPSLADTPPAEARMLPYTGVLPACDDGFALARIQRAFYDRESDYWQSGLAIESFGGVRETGLRVNGASYIPRRYCAARALFNDGRERAVVYQLGEDLGFLGMGFGVTWCVVGLDRDHAFSPNCKAAGP